MIAKLTGIIDSIENDGVVIDVNGVGYWVIVSNKSLTQLSDVGQKATLWIEQVTRQEITQLCGFLEKTDRLCFRQLLNVQGVGVRVALSILSVLTPDELMLAISAQDKTMLTRADGVGPKLAGRIVLELKDRLSAPNLSIETTVALKAVPSHDALLGLVNLGYGRSEAHNALQLALKEAPATATSSDLLRLSLQKLAKF
jgi:Holliday junction DNA helicase RuvA